MFKVSKWPFFPLANFADQHIPVHFFKVPDQRTVVEVNDYGGVLRFRPMRSGERPEWIGRLTLGDEVELSEGILTVTAWGLLCGMNYIHERYHHKPIREQLNKLETLFAGANYRPERLHGVLRALGDANGFGETRYWARKVEDEIVKGAHAWAFHYGYTVGFKPQGPVLTPLHDDWLRLRQVHAKV